LVDRSAPFASAVSLKDHPDYTGFVSDPIDIGEVRVLIFCLFNFFS
jgi:hypothetical protein